MFLDAALTEEGPVMAEKESKGNTKPKKSGNTRAVKRPAAKRSTRVPGAPVSPVAVGGEHSEFDLDNKEIEQALKTGDYQGLLEDYFGPENYAELRQLAREADSRAMRGGPKVLILPG